MNIWDSTLNFLTNKDEEEKNFLHKGEEILEELANIKIHNSQVNIPELIETWGIIIDKKFKDKIDYCCILRNPFDADGSLPIIEFEDNIEEPFPINLDDGNLLNESGSFYDNSYLANLSPNKRLSLTRSIVETCNRNSTNLSSTNSFIS